MSKTKSKTLNSFTTTSSMLLFSPECSGGFFCIVFGGSLSGDSATPSGHEWEMRGLPVINYWFQLSAAQYRCNNSSKAVAASNKPRKKKKVPSQFVSLQFGCHPLWGEERGWHPKRTWSHLKTGRAFLWISSLSPPSLPPSRHARQGLVRLWAELSGQTAFVEVVVEGTVTSYLFVKNCVKVIRLSAG